MAEPRKLFRIEQTAAARLEPDIDVAHAALRHAEIMRELRALRAAMTTLRQSGFAAAGPPDQSDCARLASELNLIAGAINSGDDKHTAPDEPRAACAQVPMSRIDHELKAVISSTELATQRILAAAEEIDSTANNLSAALAGRIEQELAQDIQDLVIRIFEACNFQDLIGQRIAKVLAAVKFVEDHIARLLDEIHTAAPPTQDLHGPRLDGDPGHASQNDIDAMFAERRIANRD